LDYANNLTLCGYSDWRLPNIHAIKSLVHAGESDIVNWLGTQGFVNVKVPYYWSSTTSAYDTGRVWSFSTWNGDYDYGIKDYSFYVLPIRTAQNGIISLSKTGQTVSYGAGDDGYWQEGVSLPDPRFHDNLDDTVTDNLTGLMWTKDANAPGPFNCSPGTFKLWQEGLDYVNCINDSNYLGYHDWRLPNIEELHSILDYSQFSPALSSGHSFVNVSQGYYWSSTTLARFKDNARNLNIWHGISAYLNKGISMPVWPLRGRQVGQPDLTSGLVAQWSFDNCDATDDSGNGHNGTIYGNPQCVDGEKGKAFSFDGVDDYIETQPLGINTGDSFTVSFWMNFEWQDHRIWTLYFGNPNNCGNNGFHSLINVDNVWGLDRGVVQYGPHCGTQNQFNIANFQGQWIHVVSVYNIAEQSLKSYINANIMDNEGFVTFSMENYGLYVARRNPYQDGFGLDSYYKGVIDEVRIYNRALTEAEIQALYDGYVPPQACTYVYSDWGDCQPDNTQTRTVLSSSPVGCVGTPVTSQSCTYVPPPVTLNIVQVPLQKKQSINKNTLKMYFLDIVTDERISEASGSNRFSNDGCYFGAVDATSALQTRDILEVVIRQLASNVFKTPLSLITTGSVLGDIFLKLGTYTISETIKQTPLDEAVLKFATEQTAGYILGKSVADFYNAIYAGDPLSEKIVYGVLIGDDIVYWGGEGNNAKTRWHLYGGAPYTQVKFQVYYNPYTHFTTSVINATCDFNGSKVKKSYFILYELKKNRIWDINVVPGSLKIISSR